MAGPHRFFRHRPPSVVTFLPETYEFVGTICPVPYLANRRPFASQKEVANMKPSDKTPTKARKAVALRFRLFIQTLMSQFTTTPAELLWRAEHRSRMDNPPDRDVRLP